MRWARERKGIGDVGKGLMLFNHAENPLEMLVVGSFSLLLR
jgi:hypothetical protein